ncbi:MAG: glycoside hydrolase, partial [Okeania sp. SIO2H7]|nr:glycoside hydrolase [Okeania sp. SIO2H7]
SQELQVAAEVALGHELLTLVRSLEAESSEGLLNESCLKQVEAVVAEATSQGCDLKVGEVKEILERLLMRSVEQILHRNEPGAIETEIHNVERLIELGDRLDIGLCVTRAQEVYFQALESQILPLCLGGIQRRNDGLVEDLALESQWQLPQIRKLLYLGKKLAIEVDSWLDRL